MLMTVAQPITGGMSTGELLKAIEWPGSLLFFKLADGQYLEGNRTHVFWITQKLFVVHMVSMTGHEYEIIYNAENRQGRIMQLTTMF